LYLSGSLPPTANQLQCLTVVQQRVYQIGLGFRDVDEFKKRLMKSGLVWNRTLSTLLPTNGGSLHYMVSCVMGQHFL